MNLNLKDSSFPVIVSYDILENSAVVFFSFCLK